MKVHLWALGAPSDEWVSTGEKIYVKRIERYIPFEYRTLQPSKSNVNKIVLEAESKYILSQLSTTPSKLILLDEKGKQFSSKVFSSQLEQWRQGSHKRVIFLIGSAYGFDSSVVNAAHELISISPMTLPHQLCRLLFLEQLYRVCTIQRGESYHHE